MRRPLSIYIHYPYCVRKCNYCDFLSGPCPDAGAADLYVDALIREIREKGKQWRVGCDEGHDHPIYSCRNSGSNAESLVNREVDTIFFGGGTPSLMSAAHLAGIMEALRGSFAVAPDAEITMECNPGTVDEDKLRAFREQGINRLSLGVQSFRDEELRLLGRIHSAQEAKAAVRLARRAGFDNLNLDLMSALPGQTFAQWEYTLREAVSLEPEHISAYSLIVEEGTPFAAWQEAGELPALPEEDEDRHMYHYTGEFLASRGYGRYEISNYAQSGYACRHNVGYWTGHDYLGFGPGAASFYLTQEDMGQDQAAVRLKNPRQYQTAVRLKNPGQYQAAVRLKNPERIESYLSYVDGLETESLRYTDNETVEVLDRRDLMEEFMFLGLRMTAGVSRNEFAARFAEPLEAVYGNVVDQYTAAGLLKLSDDRICLTERGLDLANTVMAAFLL